MPKKEKQVIAGSEFYCNSPRLGDKQLFKPSYLNLIDGRGGELTMTIERHSTKGPSMKISASGFTIINVHEMTEFNNALREARDIISLLIPLPEKEDKK